MEYDLLFLPMKCCQLFSAYQLRWQYRMEAYRAGGAKVERCSHMLSVFLVFTLSAQLTQSVSSASLTWGW